MIEQPAVTKEYLEDIIEGTQVDYRWWEYTFDFGGRRYRARLYTDEPSIGYVLMLSGDQRRRIHHRWRRTNHHPYLRLIRDHLRADTGRRIEVHILGGRLGYQRINLD